PLTRSTGVRFSGRGFYLMHWYTANMDPASLTTSGTSGLVTTFFLTIGVDSASLYPQCLQALAASGWLA
ncbi:MAG: hypothetical protein OXI88_04040, partial [Gammaproteobacteria bacterium]|nr:hypothetical protein [Gammaproteobacteria bacterium]